MFFYARCFAYKSKFHICGQHRFALISENQDEIRVITEHEYRHSRCLILEFPYISFYE